MRKVSHLAAWVLAAVAMLPVFAADVRFATYFGGRDVDYANAVAFAPNGDILITGLAGSTDFPVVNAHQPNCARGPLGGCADAFVARFDNSGRTLIYSTYLGGPANDEGRAIAVDPSGNAYVAGVRDNRIFVAKFSPDGRLLFDRVFGDWPIAMGEAIALDRAGNIYVAGFSMAPDLVLPGGFQSRPGPVSCHAVGGGSFPMDAIVLKFSPSGTLVYSTFLGGSGNDRALAIGVDVEGSIYVAGTTSSADFPLANAYQSQYQGGERTGAGICDGGDGFLARLDSTGSRLVYSTFLGGPGMEEARALTVSHAGYAAVLGTGFLKRFSPAGEIVLDIGIAGRSIAQDGVGRIYVASTAILRVDAGSQITEWDRAGPASQAIALSPTGDIAVAGEALEGQLQPVSAIQAASRGFRDAFVRVLAPGTTPEAVLVNAASGLGPDVSPGSLVTWFGSGVGADSLHLIDSTGRTWSPRILYASATQINLLIPEDIAVGPFRIEAPGVVASAMVAPVAPALFTANSSGQGPPAATALQLRQDGSLAGLPVFSCDAGVCTPLPLSLAGGAVYLSLYGTGIRGAAEVGVRIGGVPARVTAVARHSIYAGLDQVNVEVPAILEGRGFVDVLLSAGGVLANPVILHFE